MEWERIQKTAILKQLLTHFKAKNEKGAGTPFPHVPAPLHPWASSCWNITPPQEMPFSYLE